jgi:hypothetical protein
MSVEPPGGKGTMSFTGRAGQLCAFAQDAAAKRRRARPEGAKDFILR